MLRPCLLHLKGLRTERTDKPPRGYDRICPMLCLVVIVHGLSTGKQFLTHLAFSPLTMHTRLCVLVPIPPRGQHLPTLTTWEFLTPMHSHVNFHPMVRLEALLADWACCLAPGHLRNLVRNLCHLPRCAPSGRSSPRRRADTCCFTLFRALFFTTTSSAATWSGAGAGVGCGSGAAGLPGPFLATPGVASIPSASSSLERPMFGSSSVSDGCRAFQGDVFSSVHSHTDFNRSRPALTVKHNVDR